MRLASAAAAPAATTTRAGGESGGSGTSGPTSIRPRRPPSTTPSLNEPEFDATRVLRARPRLVPAEGPGASVESVVTHGSVIRAMADYAALAVGPEGRVVVAEAPQQDCDW